ncbi:MAG TPA: pyroglutamyl-peptidase I [Candidatus Binataceae bacterium]|nr:pyroglutamyl-peptidase I [Candidatus Binataceae bacterium]
MASPIILLTGFEPFGGESSNPSWEVASRFAEAKAGGADVRIVRLPVNCKRAASEIKAALTRVKPAAVIGLGQAGGRTALSIEKVAINLADERADRETGERAEGRAIVRGGPDAYFARLPIASIIDAITQRGIPAAMSLSAGAYVCNTVMYMTLHQVRRRPDVLAGFIHLPFDAAQATGHPSHPSMSLELMTAGVETALAEVAKRLKRPKKTSLSVQF